MMKLYTWFLLCLLGIVALIGIPGNILVLIVYTKRTKRNGTRVFILGLAWVDLFICSLTAYRFYLWVHEESFGSDFVCRLFSWVGLGSEMASAFVTTAVAVDRYLSICRPHLGWMTHRRAQLVCGVGIVVSAILTIPALAVYTTSDPGSQMCEITETETYRTWVYSALFVMAFIFACMMVTALVMYLLIYREVRQRMKIRPSLQGAATEREPASKRLAGASIHGDATTGITLATKSSGARLNNGIEEAKAHPEDLPKSSGVEDSPEGVPAGSQERPVGGGIGVNPAPSSSEDPPSDGSRTKLTAVQSEQAERTVKGRKSKTGKMLLLATVVFVVTWTARFVVWAISFMLDSKWDYMREHEDVAFAFLTLLQHLYYTTPAVNPAIYSFVNKKFKEDCVREVKKMNCCRGSNM